ncbi:hypothetical protein G7Z17_g3547 [Cylindrodendrum hubeiense]|uniref:Inosine/uridine-preferring nucleoside hydrolase domain-containing protein n=1 Tax=Cylindrodendrum hubeiense TaxID=595255 RepID=A0A9P5HHQ3_9HYPO|nr:hypothetical protein G7Z17_g3547 [Cylindrodendrum hubeiense]
MAPRKVIILTDPGQDQAAAIMLMLGLPDRFEVMGLVATAGNIDLSYTLENSLKLLELTGRPEIPVFAGSSTPIKRDLVIADHVHGPTGMDGPTLPVPTIKPSTKQGVDFIIETLRSEPPQTVTICSLSPLTNLALALLTAPDIAARIQEVVAMAGAYFEVGNITPTAEFNVYVDPEAAQGIFGSGVKLTLLPLDVTHEMLSTRERLNAMKKLGTNCAIALAEMLTFSESFDLKKYGWNGAPLHGPCVPLFLLEPEMFQGRLINVEVETTSQLTLGMTVADWWGITTRPKNVFWVRHGDDERLFEILNQALACLP